MCNRIDTSSFSYETRIPFNATINQSTALTDIIVKINK